MANRYIYSNGLTIAQWDTEWQIPAKEAFFAEYKIICPQGVEKTKTDYQDRITGVIQNIQVKLATDKVSVHTDRLADPIIHPSNPLKIIHSYDEEKINDKLNIAYVSTQTWRNANGGSNFDDLDRAEVEALGFVIEE